MSAIKAQSLQDKSSQEEPPQIVLHREAIFLPEGKFYWENAITTSIIYSSLGHYLKQYTFSSSIFWSWTLNCEGYIILPYNRNFLYEWDDHKRASGIGDIIFGTRIKLDEISLFDLKIGAPTHESSLYEAQENQKLVPGLGHSQFISTFTLYHRDNPLLVGADLSYNYVLPEEIYSESFNREITYRAPSSISISGWTIFCITPDISIGAEVKMTALGKEKIGGITTKKRTDSFTASGYFQISLSENTFLLPEASIILSKVFEGWSIGVGIGFLF